MEVAAASVVYAGPWRRIVGWLLDGLFAGGVFVLGVLVGAVLGAAVAGAGLAGFLAIVLAVVGVWMYFALFESSPRQATLGKMLLHEKVTDLRGNRITFERASVRHFAMYLSLLTPLLIGFAMAFWTRRRQSLHDYLSSTLVTYAPQTRDAGP